jgi:hypothetical protein
MDSLHIGVDTIIHKQPQEILGRAQSIGRNRLLGSFNLRALRHHSASQRDDTKHRPSSRLEPSP